MSAMSSVYTYSRVFLGPNIKTVAGDKKSRDFVGGIKVSFAGSARLVNFRRA